MPRKNPAPDKYKKEISKRLEEMIPIFQKIANGDFSSKISIPEKEDEFSSIIISLSMLLDDLRFLDKENREKTLEMEKNKADLEKKVEERTRELRGLMTQLEEKVKERTSELQQKVEQMENFQRIIVGRELKMIELKEEIQRTNKRLEEFKGSDNKNN
jgi:methyl-accepting chemotaxis protein